MDNLLAYLVLTAALSTLQIWENYRLLFSGGNSVSIDWSFSLIEFSWVFVSIAVIYYGDLNVYELLVPVAFLLYNIYGWIVGYWHINETEVLESKVIYIPETYLWFSLVFSVLLSSFTVFVITQVYLSRSEMLFQEYLLDNKIAIFWIIIIALLLKSVSQRFKSFANNEFNQQVINAIQNNEQCASYFGKILSVSVNNEITSRLDDNEFGFFVRGEKSRGFLVAGITTISSEEEFVYGGFISTENGEIIELTEQAVEA